MDEFLEEICTACGTRYTRRHGDQTSVHQCVPTKSEPAPRAIPVSIFSDLGAIGDLLKEIQQKREG